MNIFMVKKFSNINIKKKFAKKQNKLDILLKIILNVLRQLDFLAYILNYLIICTYKNMIFLH